MDPIVYLVAFVAVALICVAALVYWRLRRGLRGVDLVVSRYEEGLEWLWRLELGWFRKVWVYNKGQSLVRLPTGLPEGFFTVVNLPNVGRCDHTYLWHIIANYEVGLADVTMFVPGSCDMDYKWDVATKTMHRALVTRDSAFYVQRIKDVRGQLADFKLDTWQSSSKVNLRANPEDKLHPSPERPFGVWWDKNFGRHVVVNGVAHYGIFAVSARHIHQRPLESYRKLIKYLDGHSNPEAGHYFERAWLAVFHPVPERRLYTV
jgi:hypothetical protein